MLCYFRALGITMGLMLVSTNLFAHASVLAKDNIDKFTGRDYEEGKTAFLQFHLSHGCRNSTSTKYFATKHVTIVFPNNNNLKGLTLTKDSSGNEYAGNAMMSIKPAVNPIWDKIKISTATVPGYYSHGVKSTDVRGIKWLGGKVPNEMYSNLSVKASLPLLRACVARLKVYVPIVQYCKNGQVLAWLKKSTPSFPASVISTGYAPSFTVLRNLTNNPLPENCSNEGETVEVYPSEKDIEQYLPHKSLHSRH